MKNMHMFLHNLESSQAQDQMLGSNAAMISVHKKGDNFMRLFKEVFAFYTS